MAPRLVKFLHGPTADITANNTGDFSKLELQLDTPLPPSKGSYGHHVLVLGGNGFLGIHLIKALAQRPNIQIDCLLRGEEGKLIDKIQETSTKYAVDFKEEELAKVRLIQANVLQPHFGLPDKLFDELSTKVDTVFQFAGVMDYNLNYDDGYHKWTELVLEALSFCVTKQLKKLVFLGSISCDLFTLQEDFERPAGWWYSAYARSKQLALQIMKNATEKYGIPTLFVKGPFTMGTLTAMKDPGLAYTFYRMMRFYTSVGVCFFGSYPWVPVDILIDCTIFGAFSEKEQPLQIFPAYIISYPDYAEAFDLKPVTLEVIRKIAASKGWDSLVKVFPPGTVEVSYRVCSRPVFPNGFDTRPLPSLRFLLEQYRIHNPKICVPKEKRRSML